MKKEFLFNRLKERNNIVCIRELNVIYFFKIEKMKKFKNRNLLFFKRESGVIIRK